MHVNQPSTVNSLSCSMTTYFTYFPLPDVFIYARVKFDLEIVENLIFCHEWEKLEYYLFKFLSNAHGKIVRSHSGLFCSVYEACISDLIKKRKVKEAVHIFKDKVEPLSYDGDSLYRPIDLEVRVERLKQIIKNRYVKFPS